ncbi:MAG: hypothetical protein JO287_20225 [Pseudonocardiales bacterium]|nr:hypothetical protein [Pseudonocardiales bacterium]
MSPTLAGFMERLVLDPAKNREFAADPQRALAGSGLTTEECQALTSGDVSAINQMFDSEDHYVRDAIIILILYTVPDNLREQDAQ